MQDPREWTEFIIPERLATGVASGQKTCLLDGEEPRGN